MKPIIEVEHLSKKYHLGQSLSVPRSLLRAATSFLAFSRQRSPSQALWALKDISLKIMPGEIIGVIGDNGAGKSTLLKILSRISAPTFGRVILRGKVCSLLEVGTGFNPELTGRENIYLNGAILGMNRREITKKFSSIVEFAEIDKFLDTPVKHYSTGMYTRLGFSVAAHLEPDILLVDEVLAVGDIAFQRKSLGKMSQVATQGRTVIFISHNMGAIRQLCPRAVLLEKGRLIASGQTSRVISRYLGQRKIAYQGKHSWSIAKAPGDALARLLEIRLSNKKGQTTTEFGTHEPIIIEIQYRLTQKSSRFRVGFELVSEDGTYIFYSSDSDSQHPPSARPPGHYTSLAEIPANLLNQGSYTVGISGGVFGDRVIFPEVPRLRFNIVPTGGVTSLYSETRKGIIAPQLRWTVNANN